jgi:hypothetical protein
VSIPEPSGYATARPALIAGALLDNVMEKIAWNQCERHAHHSPLGQL